VPTTTTRARVTFLGSGTSHGVPMIGCECATCTSTDPNDSRLRPSIFLDVPGHAGILVDTTPDFRQQVLRHRIKRIDAILFTHSHADHILGFDEIRRFNTIQGGPIPAYANAQAWDILKRSFYYAFDGLPRLGGGVPQVTDIGITGPFQVSGVSIVPVPILHGEMPILGFRFGTFAYVTDCSRIPDASWPLLRGVDTLVMGALRDEPHPTHFTLAEALEAIAAIGPRRAYLTHMNHDLGHAATSARLPQGVELAYDGLVLDVAVDVE
jgi:phosphoribosyl 1,2-cyclic phosphate phosphodiesterase